MTFPRNALAWSLKALVVIAVIAFVVHLLLTHGTQLNWDAVMSYGKSLRAEVFIAAFFILPLLGVPISLFLILAGIRFGFAEGMIVTSLAVFFHHVVAYPITHGYLRHRLRNFVEKKGYKVPSTRDNALAFTMGFSAIPGPPYVFKLYLLGLTETPFHIYLLVGAPIYIAFATVSVGAAAAVAKLNLWWIYGIIFGVALVIFSIKALKARRAKAVTQSEG